MRTHIPPARILNGYSSGSLVCKSNCIIDASKCHDDWQSVSASKYHTCGTKTDGTLWCWGFNKYGQLGDGTTTGKSNPWPVGTNKNWKAVSANFWHTCGTQTDGTLWCWGYNYCGQLGDGTTKDSSSPKRANP